MDTTKQTAEQTAEAERATPMRKAEKFTPGPWLDCGEDMTKYEMATEIAALSGERGHLFRGIINHQMGRPIGAVRESLARQRAIARVTRREIIRHCQPLSLGK